MYRKSRDAILRVFFVSAARYRVSTVLGIDAENLLNLWQSLKVCQR